MATKKKGFALRDFNDAGTEERFEKGAAVELDAGAYANYEAAGLVGEKKTEPKAAAETPPA